MTTERTIAVTEAEINRFARVNEIRSDFVWRVLFGNCEEWERDLVMRLRNHSDCPLLPEPLPCRNVVA